MKRIICLILALFVFFASAVPLSASETGTGSGGGFSFDDLIDLLFPSVKKHDNSDDFRKEIAEKAKEDEELSKKLHDVGLDIPNLPTTNLNMLEYYEAAGLSTTDYPFYMVSYSSRLITALGYRQVTVVFFHDNPSAYFRIDDKRLNPDRTSDYEFTFLSGSVSRQFKLYNRDSHVEYEMSGTSYFFVNGKNLKAFPDEGDQPPPAANLYNSSNMFIKEGFGVFYASNFKIKNIDGSEIEGTGSGSGSDGIGDDDDSGFGFDPDEFGFEKFVFPDIPSLSDYIEKYGPIIGAILWLGATIREIFLTLVENIAILFRNILRIPKAFIGLLQKLFEFLFVPDEAVISGAKESVTSAVDEKYPFITRALGTLKEVFSASSGSSITASADYNSAMGIAPSQQSASFFSTHSEFIDTNVSYYDGAGSSAPKFIFHFNDGKNTAVIDFAPFEPYMFLPRCIISSFLLLSLIRHFLKAVPSIIGRVPGGDT